MNILNRLVNPVISLEYRLRMRSRKTPWIILFYLLVISAITFLFIFFGVSNRGYYMPSMTKELFIGLAFTQFVMISFIVPGLTAGTISGERERQTLNILLTTNLSPTKIIIGKWLSSLSFIVLLITTSIPIYSIVFLYGGIEPVQLFKTFIYYLISMLAIGSVGIFYSTIFKRTGISTIFTYGTIVTYTVLTLFLPNLFESYYYRINKNQLGNTIEDWFYSINPITSMFNIFEINSIRGVPIDPFWIFIIFFSLVTLIMLLMSIYLLKPVKRKLSRK